MTEQRYGFTELDSLAYELGVGRYTILAGDEGETTFIVYDREADTTLVTAAPANEVGAWLEGALWERQRHATERS